MAGGKIHVRFTSESVHARALSAPQRAIAIAHGVGERIGFAAAPFSDGVQPCFGCFAVGPFAG
jgi:hypothetical protein